MAPKFPLYRLIKQQLSDALRDGVWKHGQFLPPEPELARRYGASVGTLRKAVDELVAENLLVRRQGRGTHVASHTRDTMLTRFFHIVDRAGVKHFPQSRLLGIRRGRADAATAYLLRISVDAPILQIDNLLSLDGEPAIVDRIRLPAVLFPDMSEQIFSERDTTIYGLYQSRYGITVVRTDESITAVIADERVRTLLRLGDPAAVLRIVRTAYAYKDLPVDTRIRFVKTTHHRYLSVSGKR